MCVRFLKGFPRLISDHPSKAAVVQCCCWLVLAPVWSPSHIIWRLIVVRSQNSSTGWELIMCVVSREVNTEHQSLQYTQPQPFIFL